MLVAVKLIVNSIKTTGLIKLNQNKMMTKAKDLLDQKLRRKDLVTVNQDRLILRNQPIRHLREEYRPLPIKMEKGQILTIFDHQSNEI